ncbi:non-ribosomal peptide synthetase [Caballeronia temeraria]|uniref:Non-ribosomal peptide synthetase n=1 Tax=Caballeronia temeraria TaxID=1777137 RepID=A0A158D860_9BURK|nr:non-ribosomal peptide synthetase [Caballeronia temeraria]SAK90671.1 non-ribosomal peptide synthetase [Caballeronia temeraria]
MDALTDQIGTGGQGAARGSADELTTLTVYDLLERQAARTPAAPALLQGTRQMSYAELNLRANRLGDLLVSHGLGPGDIVAIALPRSFDMVVAILGVLRSGAAYLPLDPAYPAERLAFMSCDARPSCVLTHTRLAAELAETVRTIPIVHRVDLPGSDHVVRKTATGARPAPLDAAYVIYTSGSTGRPKGVVGLHAGLVNRLCWVAGIYAFAPGETVLAKSSMSFIDGATELLAPLIAGATVALADAEAARDPALLAAEIARLNIGRITVVPSLLAALLDQPDHAALNRCPLWICSGETLPPALAQRFAACVPDARLVNFYGSSEASGDSLHAVATTANGAPIGHEIWNTSAYVLDERLRPCAVGEAGELYLAGAGLARGYIGQPGHTAERFLADPHGPSGSRMYRTGDRARRRSDGHIDYLGRADRQLKIRGFRVEPGEIEAALLAHRHVAAAAVVLEEDTLVAFLVPADGYDEAALRSELARRMPDYMLPASFVTLPALPLLPNGKLDRAALPFARRDAARGPEGRTPVEIQLAHLFAEVLRRDAVGIHDDFFASGGHSLLAAQLANRIRAVLQIDASVSDVFRAPTVERLAALLDAHGMRRARLSAQARRERVRLSAGQQGMWFLARLGKEASAAAAYNLPYAFDLRGPCDAHALRLALRDVVTRHESLRTLFRHADEGPYQHVLPASDSMLDELLGVTDATPGELDRHIAAEVEAPFDLESRIPFRARLLRCASDRAVLIFSFHHIAFDGASLVPFLRDLSSAYAARRGGKRPDLPPLPVQYADFANWQRALLGSPGDTGSLAQRQLAHWRSVLADLPDELPLPRVRARPAEALGRAERIAFSIGSRLHRRAAHFAQAQHATLFMVVQSALVAVLRRFGAGTDVVIGTPGEGRFDAQLEDLVGYFVNSLVLRVDASGNPGFRELLARVREADLAAYANQDVPFASIVEMLNPERSVARHPLFQVALSLEYDDDARLSLQDLTTRPRAIGNAAAKFDLAFELVAHGSDDDGYGAIEGNLEFAAELFEPDTARRMAAAFEGLLDQAIADPDAGIGHHGVFAPQERAALLAFGTPSQTQLREAQSIPRRFAEIVARQPHAIALRHGARALTYGQLDRISNRLAHRLAARGVARETRVAVDMTRSLELIVATLAIVKAGGCYLPLYRGLPPERRQRMLDDTRTALVLHDASAAGGYGSVAALRIDAALLDEGDDGPVAIDIAPESLINVMYTSGSSGVPKGIEITHRGIVDMAMDLLDLPPQRVLFQSSFAFDASSYEIWSALLRGDELVVASCEQLTPADLRREIAGHGANNLLLTTSLFNLLVTEDLECLSGLRTILTGGDTASVASFQRVLRRFPDITLLNCYGPTETSVFVTSYPATLARRVRHPVPIGAPRASARIRVLDDFLNLCPIGVAGDLYIAGDVLARGYVGQTGITAERFVADPYGGPGARMYRTGDFARWNERGELEFAGRADQQVKVRGLRIEPGEIETVLSEQPAIRACAVLAQHDGASGSRLVAYVVAEENYDERRVLAALRQRLPDYMVPAGFVRLDRLPITSNGKLDRKALPPFQARTSATRAPATPRERALTTLFADVLGLASVGADDGFFALGGDSILSIQLVSRARKAGLVLSPADVFREKTPAALAAVARDLTVEPRSDDASWPDLPASVTATLRTGNPGAAEILPLAPLQEGLFFHATFDATGPDPYIVQLVLAFEGQLEPDRLRAAVDRLVQRHEALRVSFHAVDGRVVQALRRAVQTRWRDVDLADAAQPHEALAAWLVEDREHRFDVTSAPLLRAALLRLGHGEHRLVLSLHHLLIDGWSMPVIVSELMQAYAGDALGDAPPLREQFVWLAKQDRERARNAWEAALAGLDGPTRLVANADPGAPFARQASVTGRLDAETTACLLDCARHRGLTLATFAQGAWAMLLGYRTGRNDVAFGVTAAGRPAELQDVERRVGLFINTLPLRATLHAGETVARLLERIQRDQSALLPHQHIGLTEVQARAGHGELFDTLVVVENYPAARTPCEIDGVTLAATTVNDTTHYPVSLMVTPGTELELRIDHRADRVSGHDAQRLLATLMQILRSMASQPDDLVGRIDLLSRAERDELDRWNATARPVGEDDVAARFSAQAARAPHAIAVMQDAQQLTYRELDARSNALAHCLVAQGIGAERIVALTMNRTPDVIVAMLGVLKSGGAYLPVDPHYPRERIDAMLADAQPALTLSVLPPLAGWPTHAVERAVAPGHPAYVVYTSGSSGKPKGVVVTRAGIASLVGAQAERFGITAASRVLQFASLSFDAAVSEVLVTLLHGARLVLADASLMSAERLAGLIREREITCVTLPPALLAAMDPATIPAACTIVTAGEAISADTAARWSNGRRLVNAYGPTEVTVCATMSDDLGGPVAPPIGRPVWNSQIHVLDAFLRRCGAGVSGEIYVGGAGLARGYVARPDLSAERFVANPFGAAGKRLYRTGDLGRWRADGQLEFLGRADQQIKLRGFRIEPGEIEALLMQDDGVRSCAVAVRDRQLVAYVVPAPAFDAPSLRAAVARRLPEYMVPSSFVVLDALPLTPNGKLDRKALPAPSRDVSARRVPASEREALIARLFAEVLERDGVQPDDSFFALGGDSILSIRFVSRARGAGLDLSPAHVFRHKTPAGLARIAGVLADRARASTSTSDDETGRVPATPIMRWLSARDGAIDAFSQSMRVVLPHDTRHARLVQALQAVIARHALLRARFIDAELDVPAHDADAETPLQRIDAHDWTRADVERHAALHQQASERSLALREGRVLRAVWFDRGAAGGELLLTIHHLVVDGVSWRILLDDLAQAYDLAARGEPPVLPPVPTSFRRWARHLHEEAHATRRVAELDRWRWIVSACDSPLGTRPLARTDTLATARRVSWQLDAATTARLLGSVPAMFRGGVNDVLLAAYALAVAGWRGGAGPVLLDLERHGREPGESGLDLSRTVGWFTSVHPLRIDFDDGFNPAAMLRSGPALAALVKRVKEALRALPDGGIGYGLLRYLNARTAPHLQGARAHLSFNYLGRFGASGGAWSAIGGLSLEGGDDADAPLPHAIALDAQVIDGDAGPRLHAHWTFAGGLFEETSIRDLARRWSDALHAIARLESGGLTPSDIGARLTQADIDAIEAATPGAQDILPLLPLQEGLLFHSLYDASASDPYIAQISLTLEGQVDAARLRAAADALLARHDTLRVGIRDVSGRPVQVIAGPVSAPWREADVSNAQDVGEALSALLASERERRFDLERAPLLRFMLVRTGPRRHRLVMSNHHLLLDGWSMPVVISDLMSLYAGETLDAAFPLRDQHAWIERQDKAAARAAWRDALRGVDGPTRLTRAEPGSQTTDVRTVRIALPEPLSATLAALAQRHETTVSTILQGCWAVLLARLTSREDVVFGITVSGRPAELPQIERRVGLFINTLPLRVVLDPRERWTELFRRMQAMQADRLPHQHLGLTDIIEQSGQSELFDSLLIVENYPMDALRPRSAADELTIAAIDGYDRTHYPVTLVAIPGARMALRLDCRISQFDANAAQALLDRFVRVLEQVAAAPQGAVIARDLLAPDEAQRMSAWNRTTRALAGEDVAVSFARQARRSPDAIAVEQGDVRWTYADVERRSDRFAQALIARGIGPDDLVALTLPRTPDIVVAMLGVLKSGAAFLPVDPAYPEARIAAMLADARPAWVVDRLPMPDDCNPGSAAAPACRAHHLAYVIYTSGSTGTPKGVAVSRVGLVNLLAAMQDRMGMKPGDRLLAVTTLGFDIACLELLAPLLAGATIVLAASDDVKDPRRLARLAASSRANVMQATPTLWDALLHEIETMPERPRFTLALAGGETVSARLAQRLLAHARRVIDVYGPTETTIWSTSAERAERQASPGIGRPLWNTRVHVLDRWLGRCPPGTPGDLYIAGRGLARGYVGRPGLTAERFIADPYGAPGERMYRTGDLARWSADGELEFLGRSDHQVKIRGFRVETGEAEAALRAQASVRDCAVALVDGQLAAYLVAGADFDETGVRAALARSLPDYMVPASFTTLARLPVTLNGKLDRAALPAPVRTPRRSRAPRDAREAELARLFAEALERDSVSIDDNFFALGGHSLRAARLVNRIRDTLGVDPGIRALFEAPTVALLGERLQRRDASDALAPLLPLQHASAAAPVFCVHPGYGLSWCYATLIPHLGVDVPLYGLQSPMLSGEAPPPSLAGLADRYLAHIRTIQPRGPYRLMGWSFGGLVAHQIATRLEAQGESVARVVMLDSNLPQRARHETLAPATHLGNVLAMIGYPFSETAPGALRWDRVMDHMRAIESPLAHVPQSALPALVEVTACHASLAASFRPAPLGAPVTFMRAAVTPSADSSLRAWRASARGALDIIDVPYEHDHMMRADALAVIGPIIRDLFANRVRHSE